MMLQPVVRQSVPDQVFEQLMSGVLEGQFGPGDSLPSERRLAEVLGVSRPAVREAIQRLAQAGLVSVRQGGSTTVQDFRLHAGLELLPRLIIGSGGVDLAVVRSIVEARAHIGPRIAELAAERAGASVRDELASVVARLETEQDPVARQQVAVEFWQVLVEAADSVTFRLMFNSLLAAYLPALEALAVAMSAEVEQTNLYSEISSAVSEGDADGAGSAARALLEVGTSSLLRELERLEAGT